ncbi:hypothetical protein [Cetobacterium sp.]|uniref:hypothetical protein n=1 Tax=Cetobacterium sp. TaxID=2071632 RepID=UPI002FC8329A
MTKKDRISYVNKVLKALEKKGLDTDIALGGRSIEAIAHSKKTIDNFDKRVKRQKEKPKIQKEVEKYNEKRKTIKEKKESNTLENRKVEVRTKAREKYDKAKLSKKTAKIIKQEYFRESFPHFQDFNNAKTLSELDKMEKKLDKAPPVEDIVNNIISSHGFLESYYTELIQDDRYTNRIKNLSKAFGIDVGKYFDFINEVTKEDFKIYTDGNSDLKYDDAEEYHDMMVARLDKMEQLATSQFKIKLD